LPNAGEARLWAALVFGSNLLDELTEPEKMLLARRGQAVSPVTSYLAIEPGVLPSTEGLRLRRVNAPDVIACSANVRGQPEPPRLDRQKFLEEELGRAWRECGPERRASTVVLETTVAEVVDVPFVTGIEAALSPCLEEAAWNLDLPPDFDQPWVRWTVHLPPPARATSAGRPPARAHAPAGGRVGGRPDVETATAVGGWATSSSPSPPTIPTLRIDQSSVHPAAGRTRPVIKVEGGRRSSQEASGLER